MDYKILEDFERLQEPVQRALVRNDSVQMNKLLEKISATWSRFVELNSANSPEFFVNKAFMLALDGILSFGLARHKGDAQHILLNNNREKTLSLLHLLGLHRRKYYQSLSEDEKKNYNDIGINEKEYVTFTVEATEANYLEKLINLDLVKQSKIKYMEGKLIVSICITRDGISLLDSSLPGWQIKKYKKFSPYIWKKNA